MSRAEKVAWLHRAAVATTDECLEWPWTKMPKGYGQVYWDGSLAMVGHAVLKISGQPRPPGAQQLHSCDNPPCANVKHLSWGTNARNRQQSVDRGRTSRGVGRPLAKLDEAKVREIRSSNESIATLAERFGVHFTVVWKARTGQTWRHV